jgi:post-segregation antitoxin (ccd killing protein)
MKVPIKKKRDMKEVVAARVSAKDLMELRRNKVDISELIRQAISDAVKEIEREKMLNNSIVVEI